MWGLAVIAAGVSFAAAGALVLLALIRYMER